MSTVLYADQNHKCIKFDGLVHSAELTSNQFLIVHSRKERLLDCGGSRNYKNVLGVLTDFLPRSIGLYLFVVPGPGFWHRSKFLASYLQR